MFQRGTGNEVEIIPHFQLTKTFKCVRVISTNEKYLIFASNGKYRMDDKIHPNDVIGE
jgi:hypothetical protein